MSDFAEAYTAPRRLKVGPDGRILIPADLRREAGIEPGATVLAEIKDGALEITTFALRVKRVQAIFAPLRQEGVSIVDEFIAERRAMWGEE